MKDRRTFDLSNLKPHVRALNPQLYPIPKARPDGEPKTIAEAKKRLRQRTGPKLNKLETRFLEHLTVTLGATSFIYAQALVFEIANGLRIKPDFVTVDKATGVPVIWETKGPWVDGDSFPKLKMLRSVYPWRVFLAWEADGRWQHQEILP